MLFVGNDVSKLKVFGRGQPVYEMLPVLEAQTKTLQLFQGLATAEGQAAGFDEVLEPVRFRRDEAGDDEVSSLFSQVPRLVNVDHHAGAFSAR